MDTAFTIYYLVVDEFADLIMTAGKEVEVPIARLAQLAIGAT
jgi:S-DNA-T family DNA segregation ATPase FtsK/SpoIIIE